MKARLMFSGADFDPLATLPGNATDLISDLQLEVLLTAMADGDPYLYGIASTAMLRGLGDVDAIVYRQDILKDCIENESAIRTMYDIAVDALDAEKHLYGWGLSSPTSLLHRSLKALAIFADSLEQLRRVSDENAQHFSSTGLIRFALMLSEQLDDEYLRRLRSELKRLDFRDGVVMSVRLGAFCSGIDYALGRPPDGRRGWLSQIADGRMRHSLTIPDRDQGGFNALSELRERGLNRVADAVARSSDHIRGFFAMVRNELAFYIGALNLRRRLAECDQRMCFPRVAESRERIFRCSALVDPCLALQLNRAPVGNTTSTDGRRLIVITGANQGGKSTFLRSVGVAHLLMQCGLFVAAADFQSSVHHGVFTHFAREEDASMRSGRLDDELSRMSAIADALTPDSLLLLNESFSSTNEREGSEIADQIVRATSGAGITVFFVTHMFEFANGLQRVTRQEDPASRTLFLRADRLPTGERTFRLSEAEALPTSYGADVFARVFGVPLGDQAQLFDESATHASATALVTEGGT
jgi:hypothetical protein